METVVELYAKAPALETHCHLPAIRDSSRRVLWLKSKCFPLDDFDIIACKIFVLPVMRCQKHMLRFARWDQLIQRVSYDVWLTFGAFSAGSDFSQQLNRLP
jgi:hypothetical protein